MRDQSIPSQPVLILGGGRGGSAFLDLFSSESLFHVVGVVDSNPDAPAFRLAENMGIPTYENAEEALNSCKPCTAFNLTHDRTLSELATTILGASNIIGGLQSKLFWKMVTELKDARDQLEKSQVFTQSIISHAMEGIVLINSKGVIQSFNPACEFMFGYSQEEVVGKNVSILMPNPDSDSHDDYLHRYMSSKKARVVGIEREVKALRKSGQTFPLSLSVNEMVSGGEHFFVGIVSDITERKKNEEAITKLAHFDAVTGLPNRTLFFDRLKQALAKAKRKKKKLGVLFLDLDGFKSINDTLGHDIGDLLLKQVADRLRGAMREMDTVARFGGDEFAFVVDDIIQAVDVEAVAGKLLDLLTQPFIVNGNRCEIGCSIGISLSPKDSISVASLIRQADYAMYQVKHNGKNGYCFYESHMAEALATDKPSFAD